MDGSTPQCAVRPTYDGRPAGDGAAADGSIGLRHVLDTFPIIVFSAEAHTNRMLLVDGAVEDILGCTARDLQQDPDISRQVVHPEDRARVIAEFEKGLASLAPFDSEYRVVNLRNGRVTWVHSRIVPVAGPDGKLHRFDGIATDITPRKRVEALQTMLRDLAVALNAATDIAGALDRLFDTVLQIDGIECGGAYLVEDDGRLRLMGHRGLSPGFVQAVSMLPADSPQAALVAGGGPLYFDRARLTATDEACRDEGIRSLAAIPVTHQGRLIAVLNLASRTRDEIPSPARHAIESIAAQMGAAITRIRALTGLRDAHAELERRVADRTAELRKAQERFRMLSENALVGVYVYEHGRIVYVNPAFARIFGYTEQEILALDDPYCLVHPEDRPIVAENIRRRLQREVESVRYGFRGIRKDGSIVYCEAMGRHVEHEGVPAIMGTLLDITDRKLAEDALAESEAGFRMLTENALVGIYIIQDDVFRYVNPALAKSFGYAPEEIIGRLGPCDLTHPEDRDAVRDRIRRTFEGAVDSERYGFRGVRRDGTVIHIEVLGRLVEYAGRPAVMGTLLDVTDQVRAQQALRESEERHRTILDQMHEAVVFTDADNVIRHINAFACSLVGTTREGAIGRDAIAFHAPEVRSEVAAVLEAFHRDPGCGVVTVQRAFRDRELLLRFSPVRDAHGGYLGAITTITDETERTRLQQQLAEVRRMDSIGTLAGGIAHDFNNLMATVLGLASHLKRRRRFNDPDCAKLAQIEDAAATAGRLAHQLLDFARGGRILPRLGDLREVIAHALDVFEPTKPPGVRLVRRIANDLWEVECDATQIERVILNLCRNAVDAMPEGGRLSVTAWNAARRSPLNNARPPLPPGNYVCLAVRDTGCGIDPAIVERVFDPFFTTKDQGHGLGLASAYGIVRGHGGAITVTSKPGEGCAFRIWLPRAKVRSR